jgi:hypothetical protein
MNYVDIILTTDKRFYIGPAWDAKPGDIIGVTNQCGERVTKTVEAVMTKKHGGEEMSILEQFTGCELKRVDAIYCKSDAKWPEEKEEQDVSE